MDKCRLHRLILCQLQKSKFQMNEAIKDFSVTAGIIIFGKRFITSDLT